MTEVILTDTTNEAWLCLCGNTAETDGFTPCASATDRTSVTAFGNWDLSYIACQRCGRIMDQRTHRPRHQAPGMWVDWGERRLTHKSALFFTHVVTVVLGPLADVDASPTGELEAGHVGRAGEQIDK